MLKSSEGSVIRLRGVRHNNLKNFDLDLPLHRLIVVTGLSGSGKSSLAFDTLFAEGQRRYIETFSPYARQFFDRMDKPRVDSIEGIPPAIAIEQRNAVKTTRSTVGTMTEICDYTKMLWPHVAQLHCRQCRKPVWKDSPQQIWRTVSSSSPSNSQLAEDERRGRGREGSRDMLITFEVPLSEKLSLVESLALIARQGYQRLLLDGHIVRLEDATSRLTSRAARAGSLTVIQDRLKPQAANRARFVEACEQAYHFGKGKLAVRSLDDVQLATLDAHLFSNRLHCAPCDIEYHEPTPALFSFNHPVGACPACKGFGRIISIDYDLALPDRSLTLAEGAVKPWRNGFSAECQSDLAKFCRAREVPMHVPFLELSERQQRWVIEGDPDYGQDEEHEWPRAWYGVKGYFRWLESKAYKMHVRVLLSRYRTYTSCPVCGGARFQPETLLYRLPVSDSRFEIKRGRPGITLAEFYALPIRDTVQCIEQIAANHPSGPGDPIAVALNEVRARLAFLNEVGLGYLTLDRPTRSLSGGETERVNLTTCLGTRLVNTLFVLDEPSVGLHPRDTERLVRILEQLRSAGNTVVVVEHEAGVMRAADRIIDLGPGHGAAGGQVVFQGSFPQILNSSSITGQYLSGRKSVEIPRRRATDVGQTPGLPEAVKEVEGANAMVLHEARAPIGGGRNACPALKLAHATRHNLKDLCVEIPLARFVCVTGVSGSGKTTLVREVLLPALEGGFKTRTSNLKSTVAKASERFDQPSPRSDAGEPDAESQEAEPPTLAPRPSALDPRPSPLLDGWEHLDRVMLVDQAILGKTPRSNPAVYIGAFDDIREVFAQSEPARQRGYNASAFSFNSGQGQCERCRGAGFEKIEMQFLSDVFIRCPDCNGRRYRAHILEVKVEGRKARGGGRGSRGEGRNEAGDHTSLDPRPSSLDPRPSPLSWSIADVLEATVDEVIDFLSALPESRPAQRAVRSLKLLQEVGLGYLCLGQPINTLSGGESQRLKLVRHLAEAAAEDRGARGEGRGARGEGRGHRASSAPRPSPLLPRPTLFLFDEPTTGLHFDDVRVLLGVFQRLVDSGHSVIVIEHNLDVIKSADWIIDLGPEAGDEGGQVVAQGTPEDVARCPRSHTARFLREVLGERARNSTRSDDSRGCSGMTRHPSLTARNRMSH